MAVNGIALGAVGAAAVFIYGGIKGKSPLAAIATIVQGQSPASTAQTQPITSITVPTGDGAGSVDTTTLSGIGSASDSSGWATAIYKALVKDGATKAQACGALGNIQVESGFSPGSINSGEGAIGFCQWEGGRRTNLQAFAKAHGTAESDGTTQIGFMIHELHTNEIAAFTLWRAAPTAATAAHVWQSAYERSTPDSLPERVANANAWMQKIGG